MSENGRISKKKIILINDNKRESHSPNCDLGARKVDPRRMDVNTFFALTNNPQNQITNNSVECVYFAWKCSVLLAFYRVFVQEAT